MKPEFFGPGSKRGLVVGGAMLALLVTGITAWLTIDLRARAIAAQRSDLEHLALVESEVAERALQAFDLAQRAVVDDVRQSGVMDLGGLRNYAASLALHTALQRRMAEFPQGEAIAIIDANGDLLNSSLGWPPAAVNLAARDYFQRAKADLHADGYLSSMLKIGDGGRPVIVLVRRITAPDGRWLGLVLGAVRLAYFDALYKAIVSGTDNGAGLSLRDGTILVRYPPKPEVIGKVFDVLKMPEGVDLTESFDVSPLDGLPRFRVPPGAEELSRRGDGGRARARGVGGVA